MLRRVVNSALVAAAASWLDAMHVLHLLHCAFLIMLYYVFCLQHECCCTWCKMLQLQGSCKAAAMLFASASWLLLEPLVFDQRPRATVAGFQAA
jgi:hypothetical protein